MAYRFNGTSDSMEFAVAPFTGYTFGPVTMAYFLKRNALSTFDMLSYFTSSGGSDRLYLLVSNTNNQVTFNRSTAIAITTALNNTATWYLVVLTCAGGSALPRMHLHDGTSWAHGPNGTTVGDLAATLASDRFYFGAPPTPVLAPAVDVVAAGIKKSDSADLTVEALTRTAFTSWLAFGFDWLIGFDASGARTNVASPGSGDEVSRSGTSLVSDPPAWSWAPAATGGFLRVM